MINPVSVVDLGRSKYAETWELQRKLWELRHFGAIGDTVLFTEHDHVYTVGKGGDGNHLLASASELKQTGTDVFHVDRGGDITYHGPGQIVCYPILDLNNYTPDIHLYLRNLEEVMIRAIAGFGVEGRREKEFTGVWVGEEKIGALGVKVSKWVTMHGFALNVNTDLSKFDRIIPCGIFHKGVTSLQKVLGREIDASEVLRKLIAAFEEVFAVKSLFSSRSQFDTILAQTNEVQ
jgi:lipoate-protein ligase B